MMSAMEHSTASEAPAHGDTHTVNPKTDPTKKAYGDFHLPPSILPGLGYGFSSGQILPAWLSDRLSRLFKRATHSH